MYNYSLKVNKYAEAREKNEKSRRKQKRDIDSKKTEKKKVLLYSFVNKCEKSVYFPKEPL